MFGINQWVADKLGIPWKEASHILGLASWDMLQEMGLEAVGDSTPFIGWLTEFAEAAIDVRICYIIWTQYHGVRPWSEFLHYIRKTKVDGAWKNIAKYSAVSIAKMALKVVPVPGVSHVGGFALNAVQTTTLILIWAKYCRNHGNAKFQPLNREQFKEQRRLLRNRSDGSPGLAIA